MLRNDGKKSEKEHLCLNLEIRPKGEPSQALARRGHDIRWALDSSSFGRGQIIWRTTDGILTGGTEPRADGHIAMW